MKQIITLVFLISCVSLVGQNVGVNITVPEFMMDIRSTSIAEPSQLNVSNQDKSKYVRFFSGSDVYPDPSMSWHPGYNLLFATYDDNTFEFTEYMRIDNLGRVGIGVIDPDAKLEINGQIKITGGDPGADKVLVSDADGLASWASSPPPPSMTYAVGDFAQGGVVFWVTPNGEHGKVVSIYDIGRTPWSDVDLVEVGLTAQSDINGAGNTVAIILQDGQNISAAQHCNLLAYGGYDDWYLPSKDELNQVYLKKSDINPIALANGGESFKDFWYWSSSEFGSAHSWQQNFLDGNQIFDTKPGYLWVRAIRAF